MIYCTKAWWLEHSEEFEGTIGQSITVMEQESSANFSGLLNAQGEPLYKVSPSVPFGFRGKNGTPR